MTTWRLGPWGTGGAGVATKADPSIEKKICDSSSFVVSDILADEKDTQHTLLYYVTLVSNG